MVVAQFLTKLCIIHISSFGIAVLSQICCLFRSHLTVITDMENCRYWLSFAVTLATICFFNPLQQLAVSVVQLSLSSTIMLGRSYLFYMRYAVCDMRYVVMIFNIVAWETPTTLVVPVTEATTRRAPTICPFWKHVISDISQYKNKSLRLQLHDRYYIITHDWRICPLFALKIF